MSASPISKEIALRIGLAARELPDTDPGRLLRVLNDAIGLPPTVKRLEKLTVEVLKSAGDGEFADMDKAAVKSALACLKGENEISAEPLPESEAYAEGEMPNSIRVAFASNKGEMLDGHFGSCRRFLIYQVSSDSSRLIDIRAVEQRAEVEDKNAYRASLISDCQLLFAGSIGGPAAAKVVRAGVHPIKKPQAVAAREEVASLQRVIGRDASPWLAKVMGQDPEARIRFEQEADV
ncbi:MAG: dinitrogenase iron-molybdenum cofactor biosynthesis protein [gamma proteobacterium symbiont of Ctena orbiculata]|uniref:Dinitrogenase iron-molybdenum cofactor biosynthesis protein n=1 Tax=Candidatus Thiodiazotropha taylori TaxID=2792791 RepID=A0A944MB32_9GAMM|nr:dinitrogenase iron-molybdenum cofactor biosynthesis protein [Candidatus Thiodiazotropha taylori]PUB88857.1 MAG: dinitrogenase iron-molybdenum cofactor biosynthesis protein [gamma proteobacterium symbiont of Ctena orbiculata]MBT2990370.1 dinitrogenase iron-molybdenum cofactor biosynthesis protein [Candidatus Thiodiazotropha taylori]MBT2998024.1 dinitrogenase iron-molybdenum cofactor biosynthesis protein [Candidatus Thiodiazotropha taylori]MBT3002235.1 dinitrogenase iron-molybdenum cofactor bi